MAVDAFINQEPSDIWKNFGSSTGERNFMLLKMMMILMIQMITSADRTADDTDDNICRSYSWISAVNKCFVNLQRFRPKI